MFVACYRLEVRESKKVINWDQNRREREEGRGVGGGGREGEEGKGRRREGGVGWVGVGGGSEVSDSSRYTGFFSIYCGN